MTVAAIANKLGVKPPAQNAAVRQSAPADAMPYFETELSQARQSAGRELRKSDSVQPNKPSGTDVRAAGRKPDEQDGTKPADAEHESVLQAEAETVSTNADSDPENQESAETLESAETTQPAVATHPVVKTGGLPADKPVADDVEPDASSLVDLLNNVATPVADLSNPLLAAQVYAVSDAATQVTSSDAVVSDATAGELSVITDDEAVQVFEHQKNLEHQGNIEPLNPLPSGASALSTSVVPTKAARRVESDRVSEAVGVEAAADSVESETANASRVSGEAVIAAGEAKATQNNGGEARDQRDNDKPEVTLVAPRPIGERRHQDAADQLDRLLNLNSPGPAKAEPAGPRNHEVAQPAALPVSQADQIAEAQDPNIARVARGLQNAVQQQGGSVTLRLTPPDLGFVKIQMDIQNGVANVQFQTEQESVRTLLNHQLSNLKQALETHGLTVQKLEVQTIPMGTFSSGQQPDNPANDGRSRGQFFNRQQQDGSGSNPRQPKDEPASFAQSVMNMLGLGEVR